MWTHGFPPIFVKWVENRSFGFFCQISHDLGNDQRSKTDQKSQVMWTGIIRLVLNSQIQQSPNSTIQGNISSKSSLWRSKQRSFSIMDSSRFFVHFFFRSTFINSSFFQFVTESTKDFIKRCSGCAIIALKKPLKDIEKLVLWSWIFKFLTSLFTF